MRPLLVTLIALVLSASAFASDVKVLRVWPGYRTAESFMRISEYFTGQENPGRNQTLLRTHPDQRGGLYFLTRVANNGAAISDAKIELHVVTVRSPTEVVYTFATTVPHGERVFEVGLTGPDWTTAAEHPVAWRLTVVDATNHELAGEQSFLWSKPDRS